jgi:tRNA nucleotidyltransferase/poly(A) polymerase
VKNLPGNQLQREGLRIVKLLKSGGFKAFWVGGTVRDMLLKRKIDNLDIATSARPEQTEVSLNRAGYNTKPVGKIYGTILSITKTGPIEITTFRREGRYVYRRRPEEVTYIDDYLEDSARRDFTINAMYYDPVKKDLLDPQNGQKDIQRKLLKFVGDPKKRIDEDALRMMRAVRLSVQLEFKLEKNSYAAIKTRAKYIQDISGERIKMELDKILSSENKEQGIRLLDELGLLRFIMPEVVALKQIWHKSKMYHLEGSAFEHTLLALRHMPTGQTALSYAALFHDAGKALTATPRQKEEGLVNSFPNHENVSAELFKAFAERLRFSRKEADEVLWITKMHMKRVAFIKDMSEDKKIQLVRHKYFPELLQVWRADSMANLRLMDGKITPGNAHAYKEGVKMLANIETKKKLIEKLATGKMIMTHAKISSGPKVGAIKSRLEKFILNGKIKTLRDAKTFLKNFKNNT